MSAFDDILSESEEALLLRFYKYKQPGTGNPATMTVITETLKLRQEQLICAFGFNPASKYLTEVFPILGYATFNELAQERNNIFTTDIYKRVSLDNILKIYEKIQSDTYSLEVMQYLLRTRLERIEGEIESTVNSMVIEKYKSEMRTIYSLGIANIDFAEERLNKPDNGFRALLNEVSMIVENRLIPVGEIFFRDTILPREKQKLLNKGLIPKELIQSRINDETINTEEKKILNEYLRQNKNQTG